VCAACPSVAQHGKRWLSGGVAYRAHFDGETLTIEQEHAPAEPTDRILRRVKALERPVPRWRSRAFWEPILSALTLLMIIAGGLLRWGEQATLANLAYAVAYFAGGYFGVLDGYQTLKERRLDVNFLMIAAAVGAASVGEAPEGATLLFLFSLSNTLQNYALARSRNAVRALMTLQPDTATRITPAGAETVPVEDLQVGDRVLTRPGERIPTDGVVLHGESHVDQSPITGESVPVLQDRRRPRVRGHSERQRRAGDRSARPRNRHAAAAHPAVGGAGAGAKGAHATLAGAVRAAVRAGGDWRRGGGRAGAAADRLELPRRFLPRDDAVGGRLALCAGD
jgi:hypothetical protein